MKRSKTDNENERASEMATETAISTIGVGDVVRRFWDSAMIRIARIEIETYIDGSACPIGYGKQISAGIESGPERAFVLDDCNKVN